MITPLNQMHLYLLDSSQSMLQPLISDIFSVCTFMDIIGARDQLIGCSTWRSSLGGHCGKMCLPLRNRAAERGNEVLVLPSSNCSTSLLVGSKNTVGNSIVPGSTCKIKNMQSEYNISKIRWGTTIKISQQPTHLVEILYKRYHQNRYLKLEISYSAMSFI